MHLIHARQDADIDTDSRLNTAEAILEELTDVPVVEGLLQSAFPVDQEWLSGQLAAKNVKCPDNGAFQKHLDSIWQGAAEQFYLEEIVTRSPFEKSAAVFLIENEVLASKSQDGACDRQEVTLELRSQAAGDGVLLRCASSVGPINRHDDAIIDLLADLQIELGVLKLCVRPGGRANEDLVTIESDIVFHPKTTQPDEVYRLIKKSVVAAAELKHAISAEYGMAGL